MEKPEYRIVEAPYYTEFIGLIEEATEDNYVVMSSNAFYDTEYNAHRYFALMIKKQVENPVKTSNEFHYKILDELNEIKFELKEIVNNLKYIRE